MWVTREKGGLRSNRIQAAVRIAIATLVLAGFAARVWKIGAQSLWLDEALSVAFAGRPIPQLFTTLVYQDIHPPLYYLCLHFWMLLVGKSEFAVRYLSLLVGLPTIPATYVLGRALFGRRSTVAGGCLPAKPLLVTAGGIPSDVAEPRAERTPWTDRAMAIGLIGAFLVTFSPFLVYYSQEARMYSGQASLGLLSACALWKLLATRRWRWWFGFVSFTTLLLYFDYFGLLVAGFEALYLLGLLVRDRRLALRGILGLAVAGALFIPWVPFAYLQAERLIHVPDFWQGQLSLTFVLEHVFAAFALGQYPVINHHLGVAIVAAALVVVGLVFLARHAFRRGGGELYVLAYLLVPLLALYAVLAHNPKFTDRYLIVIAPPFYLVLALALVDLTRWVRRAKLAALRWLGLLPPGVIAAVLLYTTFTQLWQVYYGPGYRKVDNRDATAYIEQHYQPGDIVILMMDPYSFPYYLHQNIPYTTFQPGNNVEGAANRLNQILTGHKRAWVILWNPDWADPTGYARHALETSYPQEQINRGFTGLRLQLYDIDHPPRFSVRTTPTHPEPVNFGDRLQLLGYDLPETTLAAGESGDVTLYWKALTKLSEDYIVSLRLTDGRFYYWRHDGRPAADTYPTTSWPADQVVKGDLRFEVPPGTPPGSYYLEVGSYGRTTGDLNILKDGDIPDGTAVKIAKITVTAPTVQPDVSKVQIPNRRDVSFGSQLRLLGSTFGLSKAPPGTAIEITLWWQAEAAALPAYNVQLQIQHGSYRRTVVDEAPDVGTYPTSRWAKGALVEDKHEFVLPPDVPPGPLQILVQPTSESGGTPVPGPNGAPVDLGSITVLPRPLVLTPPANVGTRVDWTFGTFAHLIGFSLDSRSARPGDHLHLTLYWKALGNSGDVGYTVFTHLLDQHAVIAAQQDHPPEDGKDPTSGWVAGEYVVDHYDLAIKPNAAPGTYQIEIGLYNPANGVRVPVKGPSGKSNGNRVILATVQVK